MIDFTQKSRNWTAILYLDRMVEDWQTQISRLLQLPFVYCIHDKDHDKSGNPRKPHVHIIISFPNTTTYKHALNTFLALAAPCKNSPIPNNIIESVKNIRFMYEYLIHNTEECKKAHKHLYDPSERVSGNDFDIGFLEQLSLTDKESFISDLTVLVLVNGLVNFSDLVRYVLNNYDSKYFTVLRSNSAYFDRLLKGNYLKKYKLADLEKQKNSDPEATPT